MVFRRNINHHSDSNPSTYSRVIIRSSFKPLLHADFTEMSGLHFDPIHICKKLFIHDSSVVL